MSQYGELDNEELFLADDVAEYMFRLGDVEESAEIFGLQFIGVAELDEYLNMSNKVLFDEFEGMYDTDREIRELMLSRIAEMPVSPYRFRSVGVDLQTCRYHLHSSGVPGELVKICTRHEDNVSLGIVDYLGLKGIDASGVVFIKYFELYEGDELLMRMVDYGQLIPSKYSGNNQTERVLLDTLEERGLDVTPYRDRFLAWCVEQNIWYDTLGIRRNPNW